MRRQRNLHVLPSLNHVKVSYFSSFAVSSKSSSSKSRAIGHSTSKSHPAQSPALPCTANRCKTAPFREFQTQSTSTHKREDCSGFDDPGLKYEEASSRDRQRTGFRKPPNEVLARPFLTRRGDSRATDPDVRNRAIQLTPWRGTPTILHALGFIRELEEKYGKIWWAGLSKEKANPYEYNPVFIVIFEDAASLSRIPGFTTPSPPELPPPLNPPVNLNSKVSSNPNLVDLGPSPSLDPLENPHSQALLQHVEAKSLRNKLAVPLFVPWSERLNVAAYRQGGPALEDIMPFLASKKAGERSAQMHSDVQEDALEGEGPSSDNTVNAMAVKGPDEQPTKIQKASWEEFDEVVNIDAVMRKYNNEKLYLPSPASMTPSRVNQSNPYFRPHIRLAVARAMVEFAGFSDKPVPSMASAVKSWQKELDDRQGTVWVPWNQSSSDSVDIAESKEDCEEDAFNPLNTDDELQMDDLVPGVWPIVTPGPSDLLAGDGEGLVPKRPQYQRIADDDDIEGDDLDEWEGVGAHPLQYPRGLESKSQAKSTPLNLTTAVRSRLSALPEVLDQLADTAPEEVPNNPPILAQVENGARADGQSSQRSRNVEDLRDPWRTDPRPFRSGLGGDEPPSLYASTGARSGSESPRRAQWSKPGFGSMSSAARERGAMVTGSHSTKSDGWDKDRRGRKLRSREEVEMLKEFGLGNIDDLAAQRMERLHDARSRGELGKRESWQAREEGERGRGSNLEENAARISAIAGKEQRMEEVKNLKDRLRAILDGTKVN